MKGLVVEVEGKYAVLLNKKGQFIKIKNSGKFIIGQEAEGNPYKSFNVGVIKKVASIAAVLVLTSGLGYGVYTRPASYAYVDINPSVEITANIFDRVIGVKGLNDDGKLVTQIHPILNESLQNGIKDIVAGAIQEGYLDSKLENVVVITVSSNSSDKVSKIEDESLKAVSKELEDNNLQPEVIVQSALLNKKKEADKLDISLGRLMLIEKATAEDPAKKVEDYANVPVKEIVKAHKPVNNKLEPENKNKDVKKNDDENESKKNDDIKIKASEHPKAPKVNPKNDKPTDPKKLQENNGPEPNAPPALNKEVDDHKNKIEKTEKIDTNIGENVTEKDKKKMKAAESIENNKNNEKKDVDNKKKSHEQTEEIAKNEEGIIGKLKDNKDNIQKENGHFYKNNSWFSNSKKSK